MRVVVAPVDVEGRGAAQIQMRGKERNQSVPRRRDMEHPELRAKRKHMG